LALRLLFWWPFSKDFRAWDWTGVGGSVGGTYRKRSETQDKTLVVTVDAQREATEAGYFESVVLP
jgi:hypothetical protein